jgi:hypothetical protein
MKTLQRTLLVTAIAVFTVSAPMSYAQFGGFGKKLLEKANPVAQPAEAEDVSADDAAAEPAFYIISSPEWLMKTPEDQDAYVTELRELYPQEPPVKVSVEDAIAMLGKELLGGAAKQAMGSMLGGATSMFGGGSAEPEPDPQIELVQAIDDEQLRLFLALGPEDRAKYVLVAEQEMLVKVFKSAMFEVSTGQVKLLRAFDKQDQAAALEASASRISGECDNACLETNIKQSKEATAALSQLSTDEVDMSEEGAAQYKSARGDLMAGTFNMAMIIPLAAEWGPRAAQELKAAVSGMMTGVSGMMTAGLTQGLAEATMTDEQKAAMSEETQALASEAEAVVEAMGGNVKDLLAPGLLVLTKGLPLVSDYFKLVKGVTSYGNAKGLDTSDDEAAEYDFGDIDA